MTRFARVFLLGHAQYRFLFLEMARRLRSEHNAEIHLYCATEQASDFWIKADDENMFASVNAVTTLYRTVAQPLDDPAMVFERARKIEAWLGVTINTLAISDRHLGRGYALAGFNHPRSRQSEMTSYEQMVAGFVALADFWRDEFENKLPTLVINCGKIPALIARKNGIAYRTLAGSRYKNFHQWAHNEFFENPLVEKSYRALAHTNAAKIDAPYDAHMTLRKKFVGDVSFAGAHAKAAMLLMRHVYWRIRGYEKAKSYYPGEEVRYVLRRRRDMKKLQGLSRPLSDLEGQRFVYYPLHTEPETALQTLSPEYFFQLSTIAALSRDLPAGVKLAVKETYEAIGRRPTDFYHQIAEFKNVVILDMMELGLEVVRRADAVATITGTGGFEAAVLGTPVITFGRHNQYNFLPHVTLIEDQMTLRPALEQALSKDFDKAAAAQTGAQFLKAVLLNSFDLRDYDYINLERFDPESVTDAISGLDASLSDTKP